MRGLWIGDRKNVVAQDSFFFFYLRKRLKACDQNHNIEMISELNMSLLNGDV